MKQIGPSTPFSVAALRLAIGALLIASAHQSVNAREANSSNPSGAIFATSAADGGRLLIRRSPTLGLNVTVAIAIDGKPAGTLVRGQVYDRYIAPGRRVLTAAYSGSGDEWKATLNVRSGETYAYAASYNVNKLVLTPVSGSR